MTRRAVVLLVAVSLGLLGITAAVWQYGAAQYAAGRASVAIPVLDTTATAAAARYADSTRAHVDTVLVRVVGSALNRADLIQRAGHYPAPPGAPPDIPGLEFAGEVAAVASGVARWRLGDRVFGLVPGGAHAE